MALKPITRQEQIIAGKNLEPITRMERFLKEYGGGGGASDCDWNIMKNKPTEMVGSDTLTWDGNTEGKLTTQDPGGLFTYVKISNATPTSEDFANGGEFDIFIIPQNTVAETKPLDETTIVVKETGISIYNTAIVVVIEPDDMFTEKGTWARLGLDYCSRITINGYTGFNVQEKIKKEYLPEIGGAFRIDVTIDDEDNYVSNKSYEDICNAISNGLMPYCVLGSLVFSLTYSDYISTVSTMGAVAKVHEFTSTSAILNDGNGLSVVSLIIMDNDAVEYTEYGLSLAEV